MQKTRESIVQILKSRGQATVDELSRELELTSVTVRHHLEILRHEGLVAPPLPLRRAGPGRPQHLYRLTDEASDLFPKNYDLLTTEVLREMTECLPPEEMDHALVRIAERMAQQASIPRNTEFSVQVEATVQFLNTMGFMATVEEEEGRFVLQIANCPYERVSRQRSEPCAIDAALLSQLLGDDSGSIEQQLNPTGHCTYIFSAD